MTTQPLALGNLRHHARDTLQRVLSDIHDHASTTYTSRERRLLDELADRVRLSLEISDTLFGITSEPAPFTKRFRNLCHGVLSLFADQAQQLRLNISLDGLCPRGLEMPALRAAHEFVGNAVRHGMHMRLMGQISVSLTGGSDWVELVVADDGWGAAAAPETIRGLGLPCDLAEQFCGTVSVHRRNDATIATIILRTPR